MLQLKKYYVKAVAIGQRTCTVVYLGKLGESVALARHNLISAPVSQNADDTSGLLNNNGLAARCFAMGVAEMQAMVVL